MVKSPCLHPIFGPPFTPYTLSFSGICIVRKFVCKVTLSSPCLWASFHPLSPLSFSGIRKVRKFAKSPCLHPVFGPPFTPYALSFNGIRKVRKFAKSPCLHPVFRPPFTPYPLSFSGIHKVRKGNSLLNPF